MDFALQQGANGTTEMSWDKSTDIFNLLWFSVNLPKGSMFNLPDFGLNLSDIKKLTDDKIELIKGRLEKSTQWIIDIGKAKSITVIVEKNTQSIGRVDIFLSAIEADGTPVDVNTFRTVGGPEDGFTI